MFVQLLISGIVLGCIYGLIALGYSLIYKASGLMSFMQGDILTLGAFLGIAFYRYMKLPFFISLFLTVAVAFVLGLILERGVIRPLLQKTGGAAIYVVLATISISYVVQNGAQILWGSTPLPFPPIFSVGTIEIFGVTMQSEALLCVVVSLIFMILIHFFMVKTKLGTAMRAAAMDPMAARSCGINVSFSTGITWGISAGLAAVAGILIGPIYGVYTTLGAVIGRKGFSGAVIGGYGNMYGAIFGGIILGLVETFVASYSSVYKNLVAYVLLLIFLFIKPTGIFDEKAIQDV